MAVTYYDSIGGRILGENTGGVQTDYVPDALGSVVATRDGNGNLLNTYTYKPYGDVLTKTGASPDPAFLFCGSWGYLFLNRAGASHSVRYRVYDSKTGIWTTVDPWWPTMIAYSYGKSQPTSWVDPSGLAPIYIQICAFIGGWRPSPPDYPYLRVPMNLRIFPFQIGVLTDKRNFFEDPLSCRFFLQFSIDSCSIGKVPVGLDGYNFGETHWAFLPSKRDFYVARGSGGVSTSQLPKRRCFSGIRFSGYATVGSAPQMHKVFPPIVIDGFIGVHAGPDFVTVGMHLYRTAFPDFEFRINGFRFARPSIYSGPEFGLLNYTPDEAHAQLLLPTSCGCGGTCG